MSWLNVILWIIDTFLILTIFSGYFFFVRFYNQWQVWPINSAHDNISSTDWAKLVTAYQHQFKLDNYQIDFVKTRNYRLFSNLRKRNHRIVLTSRYFPSVGYELDYLISRLWISKKQLEHDRFVRRYRWAVQILPATLLTLIILFYFFETIFFFFGLSIGGEFAESFFSFLWNSNLLGFIVIFLIAWWLLNYYWASAVKRQVEQQYYEEIKETFSTNLDYFQFDIKAALEYDHSIWIPYLLVWNSNYDKWMGAFVY